VEVIGLLSFDAAAIRARHAACITIKLKIPFMKVSEAVTREVRIADPDETICDAARAMAALDAGVLPAADKDRVIGILTDRDIAVRAVATRKGPDTPIRETSRRSSPATPPLTPLPASRDPAART
jgi:CBS domain-containing protein